MNKKKALKVIEEIELSIADLAQRPLVVPTSEQPIDITGASVIMESDERRAIRRFNTWARAKRPRLVGLLEARVE
jgi:hypothetical protein